MCGLEDAFFGAWRRHQVADTGCLGVDRRPQTPSAKERGKESIVSVYSVCLYQFTKKIFPLRQHSPNHVNVLLRFDSAVQLNHPQNIHKKKQLFL